MTEQERIAQIKQWISKERIHLADLKNQQNENPSKLTEYLIECSRRRIANWEETVERAAQ